MTDYQNIIEKMKNERAEKALSAQSKRQEIIDKMIELKISAIVVEFSGSGDSGQIDSVDMQRENGKLVYPKDYSRSLRKTFYKGEFKDIENSLPAFEETVTTWAYEYLESVDVDWYNNDGGQGQISIDISEVPYKFNAYVDVNHMVSETAFSAEEVT